MDVIKDLVEEIIIHDDVSIMQGAIAHVGGT